MVFGGVVAFSFSKQVTSNGHMYIYLCIMYRPLLACKCHFIAVCHKIMLVTGLL